MDLVIHNLTNSLRCVSSDAMSLTHLSLSEFGRLVKDKLISETVACSIELDMMAGVDV